MEDQYDSLTYMTIFDLMTIASPDGGIGRRARLKIWCSQGCAGSIPVLGTENQLFVDKRTN